MGHSKFDPVADQPACNAGRKPGAKRPLKPKQVWAVRFWLERERKLRDRALFDRSGTSLWLPFLKTYRTMCLSPEEALPSASRERQDVQASRLARQFWVATFASAPSHRPRFEGEEMMPLNRERLTLESGPVLDLAKMTQGDRVIREPPSRVSGLSHLAR
jgi:hypothetical protein